MRRALTAACALISSAGCAPPRLTPTSVASTTTSPRAVLLAQPGAASPLFVSPHEVVRGRVRWRVDENGATRLNDIAAEPAQVAVPLPPWLGEGVALFGDESVTVATPFGLRPIVRASLTGPSVGAHELWARLRAGGDWVRIDVAKGDATVVPPPIAAPLAIPLSYSGRATTAGPEFGSAHFAVAVVDLLGPVLTRDSGATWSPVEGVRAAFPATLPARILRDNGGVSLASDDRAVPVSQTGVLGVASELPKPLVPEVATIRVEAFAPLGVRLADGDLLVADGARFARVQTDPVRVVRVGRDDTITRCELAPANGALALAICTRHEEGGLLGGRLVVGTVVDAPSGPRLAPERSFPSASTYRVSASGAVVVAARCDGSPESGSDLLSASRVCVRDRAGTWGEIELKGDRKEVVPRADGGVVVVRDDELVGYSRDRGTATRMPLEKSPKVLHVDESAPGKLVVWRKTESELSALFVNVGDAFAIEGRSPKAILEERSVLGFHGEHAMVAALGKNGQLEASLTNDGGRTWFTDAFPEGLRALEPNANVVECRFSGCRAFGWSRVGWEHDLVARDRVVELESMPRLASPPPAPKRATTLTATCVRIAPQKTIDAQKAHGLTLSSAPSLLGMPAPKPGPGQVAAIAPLSFGTVRGAVISMGPANGPWGASARSTIRFTSDLDSPGVVHESAPFVAPYTDRLNAGVSASAFAIGPGRIVVGVWTEGKTEVFRVEAGVVPEKIDLATALTVGRLVGARELGGSLLLTGAGRRAEAPMLPYAPLFDATPFVALVDANGAHASFLSPGVAIDDVHLGATVDSSRGVFGVSTMGSLPTWTGGTWHVLPLAADTRPSGGFASFPGASSDVARPTLACAQATAGWERVENSWKTLWLTIDKQLIGPEQGSATIRTRASNSEVCIERLTFVRGDSVLQIDATTRRGARLALDESATLAHRDELSCSLGWE